VALDAELVVGQEQVVVSLEETVRLVDPLQVEESAL